MQHMNFDTELINHFARQNKKLSQINADALVDEMFRDENYSRRNGVSLEPTQFTDALEILKLKRSLFLQRIQLSQTDCESLKLFLDERSVDFQGLINSGTPMLLDSDNYHWISNIDHFTSPLKSYPNSRTQDSIVVLRPSPKVGDSLEHVICNCSSLCFHQRSKGTDRKVKNSYFSLKEITKKLKRVLRNNQEKKQLTSAVNTGGGDKARPSSDTLKRRTSFDHAKMRGKVYEKEVSRERKGHETFPSNETAIGKLKLSDDSHSKDQELDIFQEAKKHLSERVKNVNKISDFENCRTPKTLGRVLCSPEYDFSVPLSVKWNIKKLSVMTESDPPPKLSVKIDQKLYGDDPIISDINDLKVQEHSSEPIRKDLSNLRYIPDEENSWMRDRENNSALLATISSRNQEAGSLSSASPSSSSTYSPQKVRSIEYGEEHQSPVSVLDLPFMEDTNTPKGSYSGHLQPLRIAFEDCDYMNEDEAIHEYVRAVLQAAGFSWNNHFQSRPSQDDILNISFPYGDILLQIETENDPQLLVDFVNDVLLEVYQQHFGCAPWLSWYIKPNTRSVLVEQQFISQVVEDVKGAIFSELLHPTLDQLVGIDIAKSSSSWLDIRLDVEDLVNTIAEDILEELIHGISL